ncbi:MAG TPA: GNAT family N-acetyltransferase [Stackebrandtia sp.]|jgi:RimJ/RimL family protein N-acetyltransferase|uniref:GNAT family N-acetyltransferase n=1 Tax=Stackebrandtia sp. TaxID=2023065 RepID=UPI002D6DBB34|nr:GNAT family N-acetyltransferase [Stackebrandtia sp.]HZE40064.1 GNAT family N-acetyltransferase [Stackebrandtia sp.]
MEYAMNEPLGELRVRTLTEADARLVVDATARETSTAMWGPRPVGPYGWDDAVAALREWVPERGQVSYGAVGEKGLVAVFGLMFDGPSSAEVAYWVAPGERGRGWASRGLAAVSDWGHRAGVDRLWLEVNPDNVASSRVAAKAGYRFVERLTEHCRTWTYDDADRDPRHDCLIYEHASA